MEQSYRGVPGMIQLVKVKTCLILSKYVKIQKKENEKTHVYYNHVCFFVHMKKKGGRRWIKAN